MERCGGSNWHPEEGVRTKELLPYFASTVSPDLRRSAGSCEVRRFGRISCGFAGTFSSGTGGNPGGPFLQPVEKQMK